MIMEDRKILVCKNCKSRISTEPNMDDPTVEPPDPGTQVKCPVCGYEDFPEEMTEEEYKKLKEKS